MQRYDATAIREATSPRDVLATHGVEFRGTRGPCPICGTSDRSQAFSLKGHGFRCFSCGAHGDAIDLERALSGSDFRGAIEALAQRLGISPTTPDRTLIEARRRKAAGAKIAAEIELGRWASYARQLRELRARVRYAGMDELALLYERISQLEQWFHLQDARAEQEGVREWASQ